MGARFLDEDAREAFKAAIEAIEGTSGVEVVVALRRRSAAYLHANFVVGTLVAFVGLAIMLFAKTSFSIIAILVDPFVVGLAVVGLVHWLPQVKRALTLPATRTMHVAAAARATFVERGVHVTMDRSGLLVYISWLEQQVALVVDAGLARAWPATDVAAAEAALTAAMPHGGAAVAKVLASFAPRLASLIARREGDINELPDAIDSEYHREPVA